MSRRTQPPSDARAGPEVPSETPFSPAAVLILEQQVKARQKLRPLLLAALQRGGWPRGVRRSYPAAPHFVTQRYRKDSFQRTGDAAS